jgi:hypothetical protein
MLIPAFGDFSPWQETQYSLNVAWTFDADGLATFAVPTRPVFPIMLTATRQADTTSATFPKRAFRQERLRNSWFRKTLMTFSDLYIFIGNTNENRILRLSRFTVNQDADFSEKVTKPCASERF